MNIKVRWKDGDRGPKGQIIEDEKGRKKIVFVASEHRGRLPRHDEVTEARVTFEKEPENPNKGFLKVIPIFAADPNALSGSEANAALLKMARDAGPVFGQYGRMIDVDLPGLRGTLKGNLVRRFGEDAPLSACWRFENHENGNMMIVCDPSSVVAGVAITTGIRVNNRGILRVVDWAQAVKDLGEPETLTACLDMAEATWSDRSGNRLCVGHIPLGMIVRAHGFTVKDVRDTPNGYVVGTINILNGKLLIQDEWLAESEAIDYDTNLLKPAHFGKWAPLPPVVHAQVVAILKKRLHSAEWHQQNRLAGYLSEEANWSKAMWETLRVLQRCTQDEFCPLSMMERALAEVRQARVEINRVQVATVFSFDREAADARIYGGVVIEDSAMVVALTAENQSAVERIDRTIKECEDAMKQVPGKHAHRDFRTSVWMAASEMLEKINALDDRGGKVRNQMDLERLIRNADRTSTSIEALLEDFYPVRRHFKNIMKEVEAQEASSEK